MIPAMGSRMNITGFFKYIFCIGLGCWMLYGCDQQGSDNSQSHSLQLQAWSHAGQAAERQVLQDQVRRFNQQAGKIHVELTFIPEQNYNAQVQAAALAGDLPDMLEFDGPYLYNYIWQGQLQPLDGLLPQSLVNDLLPSILAQGRYAGHLYSVGVFDSGLGLYARRSELQAIHARIPKAATDAWSIAEFNTILQQLAARHVQQHKPAAVLDLKLNYRGEWFTYGFSPILQSAGADLIERKNYQHSTGLLNSKAAVAALQNVQHWIQQGYVDPNLDDAAFTRGRVALCWVGHWAYADYHKAWGDDLLLLPLPDFGHGSRTGQGSWNWGISHSSDHAREAASFIHFLLRTDEVLLMTRANGAVPGTRSAVQASRLYGKSGPLRLFADQLLHGVSVPRPKTPAYPVITSEFQKAFAQLRNGADVQPALDRAAFRIDQDIRDNQGYKIVVHANGE